MRKLIVTKKLIPITTLIVSVFLSTLVLSTPKPTTNESHFSSLRALAYIKEISQVPHSVFDPDAHENVRMYIKDTLTQNLGSANVFEQNYDTSTTKFSTQWKDYINKTFGKGVPNAIKNVLAVIPGKSKTGIMLVGHYDSGGVYLDEVQGRSYGAADDGYALGTMLEIAHLYQGQQLENTLYLLFTDAEEIGMVGAECVARDKDLMAKVGFVINLEARGVSGPAYMFETSANNDKVIEFYRKANWPVSYSFATTVYQFMPAYTDFEKFAQIGLNGINFAVVEGHDHYHTPRDNYQSLSASSLQHYGEQVTPLVEAFVKDPKYSDVHYFDGSEDRVFFTLFPHVLVSYSETVAQIFPFAVLVLLISVAIILVMKRSVLLRELPKDAFGFFAALVITVAISFAYGYLMALFGKVPYSITYVMMNGSEWPTLLFMLIVAAAVFAFYGRKMDTEQKQRTFLLFGTAFQLGIALITGFLLPGASFLFLIPALLGTLALAASMQPHAIVKYVTYGFTFLVSTLLIVPSLYSFFLALTVGGTPILTALLLIHSTVSLPVLKLQFDMPGRLASEQVVAEMNGENDHLRSDVQHLAEERKRLISQDIRKKLIRLVMIVLPIAVIITGILILTNLMIIPATKYAKAQSLMANEQYGEAFALFSELEDYKDSKQTKEILKVDILKNAKVGDKVYLGQYDQDTNTENGKEDIAWQVLAVENGKMLIISARNLDNQAYNESMDAVTWETSGLRSWLNATFLQTVFSIEEQGMIAETELSNQDNPRYGTKGGNPTIDKVFLLSIEEAERYFAEADSRKAQNTAFAISRYVYGSDDYGWWWLRSPGCFESFAVFVDENGHINEYGDGYWGKAIRPVLWISLP